jgi:hypothetical protein
VGIQANKTEWCPEKGGQVGMNGRAVKEIVNLIGYIDKKCRENCF